MRYHTDGAVYNFLSVWGGAARFMNVVLFFFASLDAVRRARRCPTLSNVKGLAYWPGIIARGALLL